jgi:CheY-like chemotaxis protein
MIRMMVTDMLLELGHHVAAEAGRVGEAIELVQRTHFDIAIIDINLHGEPVFPVAEAFSRPVTMHRSCRMNFGIIQHCRSRFG